MEKNNKNWNPVRVNISALHLTNISDNTGTGQSEKIGTNIPRIFNNHSIQKRNNQRVGDVNAYQLTTANPRRIAGFKICDDFEFFTCNFRISKQDLFNSNIGYMEKNNKNSNLVRVHRSALPLTKISDKTGTG